MRPAAVLVASLLIYGLTVDHLTLLRHYLPRLRAAYAVDNPTRPWWVP